jgi:hypothetical protein
MLYHVIIKQFTIIIYKFNQLIKNLKIGTYVREN